MYQLSRETKHKAGCVGRSYCFQLWSPSHAVYNLFLVFKKKNKNLIIDMKRNPKNRNFFLRIRTATSSSGDTNGVDRRRPHQVGHPPWTGFFGRLGAASTRSTNIVERAAISVYGIESRSSSRRTGLVGRLAQSHICRCHKKYYSCEM